MADPQPPEQQNIEEGIIKDQFNQWNTILETKGWRTIPEVDELSDRECTFFYGRMLDSESRFEADRVTVLRNQGTRLPAEARQTQIVEKWISVRISPSDPYRSPIKYDEKGSRETIETEVFISDKGQAYERSQWTLVFVGEDQERNPNQVYLKVNGVANAPEELHDQLGNHQVEPLQPMRGQTLERLKFLLTQVEGGNVTIFHTTEYGN